MFSKRYNETGLLTQNYRSSYFNFQHEILTTIQPNFDTNTNRKTSIELIARLNFNSKITTIWWQLFIFSEFVENLLGNK